MVVHCGDKSGERTMGSKLSTEHAKAIAQALLMGEPFCFELFGKDFHFRKEELMLYEVAILNINKKGEATGIAMEITSVIAADNDGAIVAATAKLAGDGNVVDPKAIRVLVRRFC